VLFSVVLLLASSVLGQGPTVGVYFDAAGTQRNLTWAGSPGETFDAYVIGFVDDTINAAGFWVYLDPVLELVSYDHPGGNAHFCCGPPFTLASGGAAFEYASYIDGHEHRPILLASLRLTTTAAINNPARITVYGYCGCMPGWPYVTVYMADGLFRIINCTGLSSFVSAAPVGYEPSSWGRVRAMYR